MITNSLKYTATKSFDYNGTPADIIVTIRLDDKCKNGHEDFSITCDIYEKGKRSDRAYLAGGCCHNEIAQVFPELQMFINLHLADFQGIPMHGHANMAYHLRVGFNDTPVASPDFPRVFCEYYRIHQGYFDALKLACEDAIAVKILMWDLGIIDTWKAQAKVAISELERLTGQTFQSTATRPYINNLIVTDEQRSEYMARKESGYYTPEQTAKREKQAIEDKINQRKIALEEDLLKAETKARKEFDVRAYILRNFGLSAEDNCIYYNHTNTVQFNWLDYKSKITPEEFAEICKHELPHGAKATLE